MGPVRDSVRDVDDEEMRKLVETARSDHHARTRRSKR